MTQKNFQETKNTGHLENQFLTQNTRFFTKQPALEEVVQ